MVWNIKLTKITETNRKVIQFCKEQILEKLSKECQEYYVLFDLLFSTYNKLFKRENDAITKERDYLEQLIDQINISGGPAKLLEGKIFSEISLQFNT